jgi:putative transposase
MPRRRRITPIGQPLHVVNRSQDGRRLFAEDAEYQRFIHLMTEGRRRYAVEIYAYCVIFNHFHWLMAPKEQRAVSAYTQWVTGRHGCHVRLGSQTLGKGHVYQHRFWSGAIGTGHNHFLNVQRYIEANPVRANLVETAEEWRWSSLWERKTEGRKLLDPSPVALPAHWEKIVNALAHEPIGDEGSDPEPIEPEGDEGSDPRQMRKTSR